MQHDSFTDKVCYLIHVPYWVSAIAGHKDELLFQRGTQQAWQWAQACPYIRWLTDGERRYVKALWDLASVYLALRNCPSYRTRKVWREGLEVAMKIKGFQGQRRVIWVKPEHPFTAISPRAEVHANHNEAQNAALRRRCSTYRRRQNLYAKTRVGLQRILAVQRIIHNWVKPHWGLGKHTTWKVNVPSLRIGFKIKGFICMALTGVFGVGRNGTITPSAPIARGRAAQTASMGSGVTVLPEA